LQIRTENTGLLAQLEADKAIIESALTEARMASESKSRFLAAASHDLRQPLHALTMFVSTLTFHVQTADARRLLTRISETARLLEEQFESLLDLSRFEVGAIQADIKAFRLDSIVERVAEELRADAQEKGLTLRVEAEHSVASSDPLLVTRVLQNLTQNAVKYTARGTVTVRLHTQPEGIRVEVVDTGPGIPADQQNRIFEEYVQLANPARQRRYGVGLGLAIVRRIDTLLALHLHLESEVGKGSCFSFWLPRGDAAAVVPALPTAAETANFRTTAQVWVLDDDRDSLDAVREQLTAWGARVLTFELPEDMVSAYGSQADHPDWIFTDDMLGSQLSGLDTARTMLGRFGHRKVCLITGNTDPRRLTELRQSGFPVILKPTRPATLISILQS
jgi:nitrogen-specific signal transduction histidine kinase